MTPNVKGDARTAGEGFSYAVLLFSVSLAPYSFGFAGPAYGLFVIGLGGYFVYLCARLKINIEDAEMKKALCRRIFIVSIFYLFGLFAVLPLEKLLERFLA